LFEETGLTVTVFDLTMLSGASFRVPLGGGKYQLVYVYSAFVDVPYINADLRTPAKVEQAVTAKSIVHHDDSDVVSRTIDIDGLSLTPFLTGLVKESQRT
jgi:hypothetical protein